MVDMTYFQTSKRLLGVLALVGVSVLSPISTASAHTELVSTSPAADSDVNVPQESISITFSEPPLVDGAAIVVMNEAGEILDTPAPTLSGATLSTPWPSELTPGQVFITWRAAADDGHVQSGEFSFRYTAAAESGVAPSAMPADAGNGSPEPMMSALDLPLTTALPTAEAETSGASNTAALVAIAALAGLIAVGFYLRRGK
ncbi:MAG: copper resistance protein CopC [Candidatus Nanopelagicales bacterium]|nr:copper resistance protein CopC [Candidatus Nanopelagicales bacterium]